VECDTPGQFRVKYRDQDIGRFRHCNVVIYPKQDLNPGACFFYLRSPDERERDRARSDPVNDRLRSKTVKLAPETVAFDFDFDQAEMGLLIDNRFCQEDRACAGPPDFHPRPEALPD